MDIERQYTILEDTVRQDCKLIVRFLRMDGVIFTCYIFYRPEVYLSIIKNWIFSLNLQIALPPILYTGKFEMLE